MARTCTVCVHPEREQVDELLVAGFSNRRIAAQFQLTEQALRRHKGTHLPKLLAELRGTISAASLMSRLEFVTGEIHRLRIKAESKGDLRTALAGLRDLARIVQAQADLSELAEVAERVTDLELRLAEIQQSKR